ncbi:MAG: UDP-N-acetylmuramoyl-tripeptide--D-alanyl-D-alanine ligase [Saprospiraceae bacterium]|nr:UDP-N-acetylmuramoyl-tripeptide--D-alanyl-D-alanine ligase [Saprospiraceae bacterium]
MLSIPELYAIYRQHPVVCTDTRKLTPGCLFFALKGDLFDGNKFAEQAIGEGAAYAVIDDPMYRIDDRCLLVPDTLQALQQLATHHRRQFDIPMIAIGGSNGKTTTKELISAVLSSHYPCHFTKGNFNNHIGVPLTLLAMPDDTEVAVIEMGTNQPGDIDQLCDIARPTHGLLTNIGKEHLEGFGDLEGVKKAEGELYRYLGRHKGWVFVNLTEKYLPAMTRRISRKIGYALADALEARDDEKNINVMLTGETPFVSAAFLSDDTGSIVQIQTQLVGRHNFNNIMTAIALGIYFKVPSGKIKSALEEYTPSNNRSQLLHRGSNTIFLDAYNANPSSVRPALESLRSMPGARKVAILGDMLELGADSLKEHEAILRFAVRQKPDTLVLVGPEFGRTHFRKYKALHFPDTAAAKAWFDAQNFENCTILLKGSRGIRLEGLLGS